MSERHTIPILAKQVIAVYVKHNIAVAMLLCENAAEIVKAALVHGQNNLDVLRDLRLSNDAVCVLVETLQFVQRQEARRLIDNADAPKASPLSISQANLFQNMDSFIRPPLFRIPIIAATSRCLVITLEARMAMKR
jgi:hypothetical protein